MPKRPKPLGKQTITVIVDGNPITVILHPPASNRTSWYAFWNGLVSSKSTGQTSLQEAIVVAENMVRNNGQRASLSDTVLTDDEFTAIQRAHFDQKTDEDAQKRAVKSLSSCVEAIAAFREITGLSPVSIATPADCANFQRVALTLPNTWRKKPLADRRPAAHYSDSARAKRLQTGDVDTLDSTGRYSPNNVLKWIRTLHAAFDRANHLALKRKCVRGIVDDSKLLRSNPWSQFTWIEGRKRPIRQFDGDELLAILIFLETEWSSIRAATAAAKVFLWSGCRKLEIAGLLWDDLKIVGSEYHFEIIGKWGVEKWFRIPETLYEELLSSRTKSNFVFAAYVDQLRKLYAGQPNWLRIIGGEFSPVSFGKWFYKRIKDWSATNPKGNSFVHVFRKTTLQYTRRGEDINRRVASDARVTESVLMTNYVKEEDEEMRQRSNRTFQRILASLAPEVARRYGHVESAVTELERRMRAATEAKNWHLAGELAAELRKSVAG